MADLPWFKYYPTLFNSDTALCSNKAVGGWQRLLNLMIPKKLDSIEGNIDYFARALFCSPEEALEILEELRAENICEITIGKKIVTLTSRRLKKENDARENNRLRKRKQRSLANVTPDVPQEVTGERLDFRSKSLDFRKEDKKDIDLKTSCPELKDNSELPPPLLKIPLIKRDGEFIITQEILDELTETFPAVNVMQEIRELRLWNINNPKKRKTKSGIHQHIATWLEKEQNKGGKATSGQGGKGKTSKEYLGEKKLPCFEMLNDSLETDTPSLSITKDQYDELWKSLEAVETVGQLEAWEKNRVGVGNG